MIARRALMSRLPVPPLPEGRDAVLMLHGWASDASVMAPTARRLEWHCVPILLELPGHGHAGTPARAPDLDELAGAAARLMAGLAGEGRRVVLAGWSWGCATWLRALALGAPPPAGVVLAGAFARLKGGQDCPEGVEAAALRSMALRFRRDPEAVLSDFAQAQFSDADRTSPAFGHRRRLLAASLSRGCMRIKGAMLAELARTDLRAEVGALEAPMALLHGGEDAIVPVAAGRWLAAHCPGAELSVVAGAGHALPLFHSDRIAERALGFLKP
jgi:pimeloyl-[acyl-carrier protein] methyl ester esterase